MRTLWSMFIAVFVATVGGNPTHCIGDSLARSGPLAIFDADPQHLWNRIHSTFFVRTGPDDKVYGVDYLEPPLWRDSKHLFQETTANLVDDQLQEIIRSHDDPCFRDPLKRAILQRDLWLVASWRATFSDAKSSETLRLLAKAIGHLALTADEIAKLPDNYVDAIKSRTFPTAIDPERLSAGYLPADLLDPQGAWVCVGRTDNPTAPGHRTSTPFTNSVFLVFIKHAEGRDAGFAFVKKIMEQEKPLLMEEIDSTRDGLRTPRLNLDAPQLPVGSQLALVRRMMLIDQRRQIVASPLTESVQIREITTQAKPDSVTEEDLILATKRRADFKFELSRAALFRGEAGGLQDVSDKLDLKTGFLGAETDPFQRAAKLDSQQKRLNAWQDSLLLFGTNRESCAICHRPATTYGMLSLQRIWSFQESPEETRAMAPMFPISSMERQEIEQRTIRWKEKQPEWLLLKEKF